jgi:hypothetical protein
MCKKFMLLWLSNGLRATASRVDVWRNKYANRTTRTETPSECDWPSRNGSAIGDGRASGQQEIRPGAIWQGGREGAGGNVDAGTPVGDCETGGGSTVGVMYFINRRQKDNLTEGVKEERRSRIGPQDYDTTLESSFLFSAEDSGLFRVKNPKQKSNEPVPASRSAPLAVF